MAPWCIYISYIERVARCGSGRGNVRGVVGIMNAARSRPDWLASVQSGRKQVRSRVCTPGLTDSEYNFLMISGGLVSHLSQYIDLSNRSRSVINHSTTNLEVISFTMSSLQSYIQELQFCFRENSQERIPSKKVEKIQLFLSTCYGDPSATEVPLML